MTATAGTTHHIVLSDGTTVLGLMTTDNMESFLRQPVARTALKTGTGDTLYSDLEPPFNTKEQANLSGGRAQKHLRVDPSKFYDTWGIDTRIEGQATLGPKTYASVLSNVGTPEYNPGDVSDVGIAYTKITQETGPAGQYYQSVTWRLGQSFTTPAVVAPLVSIDFYASDGGGSFPANTTFTCRVHSDDDDKPGTVLATKTASASAEGWITFTFDSAVEVDASTLYWLTIYADKTDWWWLTKGLPAPYAGGRFAFSGNAGSSWSTDAYNDTMFRVAFAQRKRAMSFDFSGAGTYTVQHITLYLKRVGTATPTVRIETTSGSLPSGTLADPSATATLSSANIKSSYSWVKVDFTDFTLNKTQIYWIVVYENTQRTAGNALYWGSDGSADYDDGSAATKTASAAWAEDTTQDYYFRINNGQALSNEALELFIYKGALYAVDAPLEGDDASHIWLNGDRGAADDNTADKTKLNDATKSWTTDEWANCVVKITGGPGKGEWRTVESNTSTALTLDTAWTTTHTTSTEYAILGSTKWTDVSPSSGDEIDAPVTDVLVANGIIYLACGDDQNILTLREYNNAGTWTRQSRDDGTNKAVLLLEHKQQIWRSASDNQVSYADVAAWGTDLVFGSEIKIGTTDYPITALIIYDSDVWVGKEDSLWSVKQDVPERIPVDFSSLAGPDNTWRMSVWNVYLFFPMQFSLERLYGLQVDDMGPNRQEGLPDGRQGPIKDLIATPGILYALIDAGDDGYSSILAYNDLGWHEYVRADSPGKRIRAGCLQVIPGGPNRMWFGMGKDVAYVLMPDKSINPYKDSRMTYRDTGEVVTSWVDLHLADVDKYFKDVKLVTEHLSSTVTITAYYQLDGATDADDWNLIGTFTSSPIEEQSIGEAVTGRRIRFKFVFATDDTTTTPNLVAWTLDSLARIKPKGRWEPSIKLANYMTLLDGSSDGNTRADILSQLATWAGSATPLTMTSADPAQTDVTVFIEDLIETRKKYQASAGPAGEIVEGEGKLPILEA